MHMKLSTSTLNSQLILPLSSSLLGKATTVHRLILLDFLQSSMNSLHVLHAIQKGLMSRRLIHDDVFSVSADGCSVNLRAHAAIERDMGVAWFLNLCISHCTNNAGDKANFPTFATFWALLMKVFMSDKT